jgi:hypothetical protein
MNSHLRNSLHALAVASGAVLLGLALGEPPRPGALAGELGYEALEAAETLAQTEAQPTPPSREHAPRRTQAMPFFSFARRVSAGAR